MLGGSSCCGSAKGGAKNTKKKVVKPKKGVVKKIKGGNTDPETGTGTVNEPVPDPVTEPGNVTGGAKKTKNRVVKSKKIVKKYGKRKGGYADPPVNNESDDDDKGDDQGDKESGEDGYKESGEDGYKESGEDGVASGGAKKKKGSKVVKRALSPYNKFVKKNFAIMKKKFPNEKAPQIMQKVAIEWKIFKNK